MNELASIDSRAAEHGVGFILAGGHAVIAHGFPRSTFDLDLVVRKSDRKQWLSIAADIGYVLQSEGAVFAQFSPGGQISFPLDLMFVEDETFRKMEADALPASAKVPARIVSLQHLLALKCHAIKNAHPGRIIKDAEDVIQLVKKNRVDIEAEPFRTIFLKYGPEDFYAKLRRATGSE